MYYWHRDRNRAVLVFNNFYFLKKLKQHGLTKYYIDKRMLCVDKKIY
jgi:hypothetical protein